MKKFVINLPQRQDRRDHFENHNPYLKQWEYFEAIDGYKIKHEDMQRNGFSVDHKWRDPFKKRRITKGEVGCFLSHWTLWRHIARSEEGPALVLEDDCILDDSYNEALYEEIMEEHDLDILYLGYNENTPGMVADTEHPDCIRPYYPYNTHAYVISNKAAKKLIETGFYKHMKPVDEVLSALTSEFRIWALRHDVANQASRSVLSTDVEPKGDRDYFQDFNVHAITVGSDTTKCAKLNDSAKLQGFEVKNIGANVKWNGSDMSGPGGGQKINLIKEYISTLPDNDIVLFTDAYDVFFQFDLDTITRRYLDMQAEVIFAAESECWPNQGMASKHPQTKWKYKYLNSGTFIGRVGTLKNLFSEDIKDEDDDQLYIQRIWTIDTNKYSLILDYEQYIFQTNDPRLAFKDGMLLNVETGCFPCLYHGNGGPNAKQTFESYYNTLFGVPEITDPLYIPHHGKLEILDKDMLVVDFMTNEQCQRLIEIADNHGGWAPMPEDKFPAYEIRMKELNLWYELCKHWEEHIHPIVEQYWKPLLMYGMRDAFVMRYSVDTQKSLALHNDASLVTGSVKLNDNYKGASLVFPRQGVTNDDVPVGKMILFPGSVTHGHECTQLEEGVKYSFTMWTSRYAGDVN